MSGENPFSLLQEAVREIRDADEELICALKKESKALRAVPVRVGTALFTSPRQCCNAVTLWKKTAV